MSDFLDTDRINMPATTLERELVIVIDTPTAGVDQVIEALGTAIPLVHGNYDQCVYVREGGYQQFLARAGSHAGEEATLQRTAAAQIEFSIVRDEALLRRVFDVVFAAHVNEEPTIRVYEAFGSRSKLLDDRHNPNRYWNRPDADQLHGTVIEANA